MLVQYVFGIYLATYIILQYIRLLSPLLENCEYSPDCSFWSIEAD